MRRIVYDVPRWSIFVHREARGLGQVDRDDPPGRRFEDELFERLYAGELESLPEFERDRVFGAWAERVHGTCGQLPAFERLAAECRGDADAAGTALESLLEALRPDMEDAELRRATRWACDKAAQAVEDLRDAIAGLEHVGFGHATGPGSAHGGDGAMARSLAARLKNDERLRRIAHLAGRFRRIAAARRRSRVRHGCDEIVDVEQGADLGRLLPSELVRLVHPRQRLAMLRDFLERKCQQYELAGTETLGKGPVVVCLDKSGSMEGPSDVWATAVALALLDMAQRERRPFVLLGFDGTVKFEAIVEPGEVLPADGLFVACDGGTDIDGVVSRGLDIVEHHPGALRKADMVLITDGQSPSDKAHELRQRAAALEMTIVGIGIGIAPASLTPWCNEVHGVLDLGRIDQKTSDLLFEI